GANDVRLPDGGEAGASGVCGGCYGAVFFGWGAVYQLDGVRVAQGAVERDRAGQRVAHPLEVVEDRRREAALGSDADRRGEVLLAVDEPGRTAHRRRDVDSSVDQGRDDLGVDLRLGVTERRRGHAHRQTV